MPPLAINPYIHPYTPYLRYPLYYLTWLIYYLTYLLSPGILTILQLVLLLLEHLLPRIELWVEVEMRGRLRRSLWAQEGWKRGGRGLTGLAADKGWIGRRRSGTVRVEEATSWTIGLGKWVASWFGGAARKAHPIPTRPVILTPRPVDPALVVPSKEVHFNNLSHSRAVVPISPKPAVLKKPVPEKVLHAGRLGSKWGHGEPGQKVSTVQVVDRLSYGQAQPDHNLDDHLEHGSIWSGDGWKAS
ncbi:hypothetical protein JCM16303_006500 [Sporobolomyces ruberrimus]